MPFIRSLSFLTLWISGSLLSSPVDSLHAETGWPKFQGPAAPYTQPNSLSLSWSSKEDIAWMATIPGYGQSSPVIYGPLVVVTSIEGPEKEIGYVVGLHAKTGDILWECQIKTASGAKNNNYVSRAAPTPIIDSKQITAFFEGGNLLSLDHRGEILWQRNLVDDYGEIQSRHGLSASLEQNAESVFVWIEREHNPYVMAVSKKDGQTRWKVPGLGTTSWSSPRLIPVEETTHLVLSGIGKLVGLDSQSGEIRWKIDDINGNSTPTPVPVGDGRFLIAATTGREGGGGGKAARSNGLIGITKQDDGSYQADFLWRAKRATSSFGSPLAHNGLAYFVNRQGVIYCLDLESGEEKYTQRTADSVWATPFAAGEHLYFFGKKGTTTVIRAGHTFEEVAVNQLLTGEAETDSEKASPARGGRVLYAAIADKGRIFLRTGSRLYCIR